jgi:hypothetical protein
MAPPPRALAVAVAGLLGAGAIAVAAHRGDSNGGPVRAPAPSTSTAGPAGSFTAVPRAGQALVAGTVTGLTADNAEAAALALPLTITIPNRGQGGADFHNVAVNGQTVAISWYGGQPLPVSGTGSMDLAGAPVTVEPSGITWMLDGAPRALTPGRYFLGAPVAAGASGLGTPMDSVTFEAGSASTMETSGGARVHLPAARLHLEGPGRVTLHGVLALRTPQRTRRVADIHFGPGDYRIDLTPAPGGYRIDAILQGPVTAPG